MRLHNHFFATWLLVVKSSICADADRAREGRAPKGSSAENPMYDADYDTETERMPYGAGREIPFMLRRQRDRALFPKALEAILTYHTYKLERNLFKELDNDRLVVAVDCHEIMDTESRDCNFDELLHYLCPVQLPWYGHTLTGNGEPSLQSTPWELVYGSFDPAPTGLRLRYPGGQDPLRLFKDRWRMPKNSWEDRVGAMMQRTREVYLSAKEPDQKKAIAYQFKQIKKTLNAMCDSREAYIAPYKILTVNEMLMKWKFTFWHVETRLRRSPEGQTWRELDLAATKLAHPDKKDEQVLEDLPKMIKQYEENDVVWQHHHSIIDRCHKFLEGLNDLGDDEDGSPPKKVKLNRSRS